MGPDAATATVSWGASSGSFSSGGVYTAPSRPGTYSVYACVTTEATRLAVAEVVVASSAPPSVTVNPSRVDLPVGGTSSFTSFVDGGVTGVVTWTCSGGAINASTGAYTAPTTPGTYTVTATSSEDTSAFGTATVRVKALNGTDKSFTYDLNGNMTSDGQRTFEWDAENRLVAVVNTATGHRSEFGYDGLGRRVCIRELDPGTGGNLAVTSDTKYLWIGGEISESRTSDGGTVLQRYFKQGFMDADGTFLFYTRDHLGTIRGLTDGTQTVQANFDYDPYGVMTQVCGTRVSMLGYTDHFWHAPSGLNLTLYRAFDQNLGRWISRDPIEEIEGLKLGYLNELKNLYGYVNNSPINFMDYFGLKCGNCQMNFPGAPLITSAEKGGETFELYMV